MISWVPFCFQIDWPLLITCFVGQASLRMATATLRHPNSEIGNPPPSKEVSGPCPLTSSLDLLHQRMCPLMSSVDITTAQLPTTDVFCRPTSGHVLPNNNAPAISEPIAWAL